MRSQGRSANGNASIDPNNSNYDRYTHGRGQTVGVQACKCHPLGRVSTGKKNFVPNFLFSNQIRSCPLLPEPSVPHAASEPACLAILPRSCPASLARRQRSDRRFDSGRSERRRRELPATADHYLHEPVRSVTHLVLALAGPASPPLPPFPPRYPHASRITHHAPVLRSAFLTAIVLLTKAVDGGGSRITQAGRAQRPGLWTSFHCAAPKSPYGLPLGLTDGLRPLPRRHVQNP